MKTLLAVLAAGVLCAQTATAVPQTVGPGFLNAVGMSFEQYAASAGPWAPDAELKGPWHRRGTQAEKPGLVVTYDLGVEATVFGIPAAQVSAERTDGKVLRFTVRFDESKLKRGGKGRTVALLDQVVANITALAGEPKSVSPSGEKTFRHEASLISARKAEKGVIVDFTPVR